MATMTQPTATQEIVYPESDGEPMADNTEQFQWIVLIKENLEAMFADRPDVFVAGDLLWYPVEGEPTIRRAPDAMVAFGRPKGPRGSYRQWDEGGVAPQVVFEVLSPGNRLTEMIQKFRFYERYGVEEYYIYDPDTDDLLGFMQTATGLQEQQPMDDWISPRLGIRFDRTGPVLRIYNPDGMPFISFTEAKQQRQQAEQQREQAEQQRQVAEERTAQLAARLRALGIDPDAEA